MNLLFTYNFRIFTSTLLILSLFSQDPPAPGEQLGGKELHPGGELHPDDEAAQGGHVTHHGGPAGRHAQGDDEATFWTDNFSFIQPGQ